METESGTFIVATGDPAAYTQALATIRQPKTGRHSPSIFIPDYFHLAKEITNHPSLELTYNL